jgi:Ca2+-transporting ATPase
MDAAAVIEGLQSSRHGLSNTEATHRLSIAGPNTLPEPRMPGIAVIFLRQFRDPMIYILLAAAIVSLFVEEYSDAIFIMVVLLINALIGTIQEHSAQQSASALRKLVTRIARVQREETLEIQAENLVPGDIVLLESGDKVPADLRLISCNSLQIDESLLTGESLPVTKDADVRLDKKTIIADRLNMAFSGTLVTRGRGVGIVAATGLATQIGEIARAVLTQAHAKPPLLVRMERFTFRLTVLLGIAITVMGIVTLMRGMPFVEVLLMAAALAVAAIPEGLPVALTVALSISMRRMAKRNVIARRLVTVEALGSCTFIATDKTGTLTINELTAHKLAIANNALISVSGEGAQPVGDFRHGQQPLHAEERELTRRLCLSAVLDNEGFLGRRNDEWVYHGDAVDVSLLVMAHKLGITRPDVLDQYPELAFIPFESVNQFSASLNQMDHVPIAHVKGALERLLPMCERMASVKGDVPLDAVMLESQAESLAREGYRVLAIASGEVRLKENEVFSAEHLTGLTLLGLVGMIDPLRSEVMEAIQECHSAGLSVAMVTGDHPVTALSISKELGLAQDIKQVVTGKQLYDARGKGHERLDALTRDTHVFARVEPHQKLDIVQSLQRNGHFVAVTGDGANDAPALRVAHVGVAMGKKGTDVARETSDMIITDDNFASIVAGIEEGRIAYANVRKVIFLLISTGGGEIILFTLSLLMGLPLPLTAVQLLWLNLVSNGIQDVALAFEPGEGDELKHPPRSPNESIFNRLMIERVAISALVIGSVSYALFNWLLAQGYAIADARNSVLLLMILFENVHVFNSRSETRSAFRHNLLRNPFLLFGTITAQLVHIGAMYTPGLSTVLDIHPVSFEHWAQLLILGVSALVASEIYKVYRRRFPFK